VMVPWVLDCACLTTSMNAGARSPR
jgi:hypothetical protein